jgi:Fic family protein
MGEVLEYEAAGRTNGIDARREADIEEVLNYRVAMRQATDLLQKLPLCNRLVKTVHETLMSGVRGHDKARGRFRTIQNHIGRDQNIKNARFVPISPEELEAGMANWERYLHVDAPDRLIQLAIVHAEFESLHPFLDGNGRMGRMLIPLFLYYRKLLNSPMFYLSEYLEANRQEYYDRLLAVSRDNDWTGWSYFFLEAIIRQAAQNEAKARQILDLYRRRKDWVVDKTRSQHAIRALDFLFNTPIFNASHFIETSKIPAPSARRILGILSAKKGLLKTLHASSGRRPAVYAFSELLNIAEGKGVF